MKSMAVGPLRASRSTTLYLCGFFWFFFFNLKCAKQCKASAVFRNSGGFMLWTWRVTTWRVLQRWGLAQGCAGRWGRRALLASCARTAWGHGSWTWDTVFQIADWKVPPERTLPRLCFGRNCSFISRELGGELMLTLSWIIVETGPKKRAGELNNL